MAHRIPDHSRGPEHTIEAFGEPLPAHDGETVAAALLAADRTVFSRSVKYHRPRGPFCLAGRCSNCLVRIDGVPNKFACTTLCAPGMRVEAQNVLGSASHDALGAIDFLFPRGLDHHEMFAGVPVVEKAVAGVARHLAGLGKLPDKVGVNAPRAETRSVDLAVVGAGPAGLALAKAAAEAGLNVELVDESAQPGGRLECELPNGRDAWENWADGAADAVARRGRLTLTTLALAGYRDSHGPFLALRTLPEPESMTVLHARRFAICTGGSETLPQFGNNDLPGIYGARGLMKLIRRHGVLPGERAVILAEHAEGLAVAEALAALDVEITAVVDPSGTLKHTSLPIVHGTIESASGRTNVSKIKVEPKSGRAKTFNCDMLVVSAVPAPSFELARQLGLKADFMANVGFTLQAKRDGTTPLSHVFLAGEVTGPMDVAGCIAQGEAAAKAIIASVRAEVAP